MTLYLAVITTDAGQSVEHFRSAEARLKGIYELVTDWWAHWHMDDEPIPDDREEAIERYFEETCGREVLDYHEIEVPDYTLLDLQDACRNDFDVHALKDICVVAGILWNCPECQATNHRYDGPTCVECGTTRPEKT